jgi:hypothetical protein
VKATFGSGKIGGKAKGLVFAREILEDVPPRAGLAVIIPESWYLSTEVYQEFIEANRLLPFVEGDVPYDGVERAFLRGHLSDSLLRDLRTLLETVDYPLAIRSSSLLEDSARYSFAGKYLTEFIPNSGDIDQRLYALEASIKRVFASTFNPSASQYRKRHGLHGEMMAVIIQSLQGRRRWNAFYPEISGVGFSRNYRRWTPRVRVEDGVVRLVFGMGTRCTGRGYARNLSLSNLKLRPEGQNPQEIAKYSQETFDILSLASGQIESYNINSAPEVAGYHGAFRAFAQIYNAAENALQDIPGLDLPRPRPNYRFVFTFHRLPHFQPALFSTVRFLFETLEKKMGTPVDIKFTFETDDGSFSLVQARPLSSYEEYRRVQTPDITGKTLILRGDTMVTNGVLEGIRNLVYVDHDAYRTTMDRYAVSREIGRLNAELFPQKYILVGPGRWGSSDPSRGVPVQYAEISGAALLVEMGISHHGFTPELSYGTHFFADLELDGTLYMPVFDNRPSNVFNVDWLQKHPHDATRHKAVRLYRGDFSAYLDGQDVTGSVVEG